MEKQLLILAIGIFVTCSALPAEDKTKFVDYEIYKVLNRQFPEGVSLKPFSTDLKPIVKPKLLF